MNILELKTLLEYVLEQMRSCKSAAECQEVMQTAIGLCVMPFMFRPPEEQHL